jgi:glutamate/tyrosine decarboxylase-like PLP-dependent enzyme
MNAAYLNTGHDAPLIPSPLNIGIENSRRFRALPVYSTLIAYGTNGYSKMLKEQIVLARKIAAFIDKSPDYVLLPKTQDEDANRRFDEIYIIVLFRAKNDELNKKLVYLINKRSRIYVSGTVWDGAPAARIAISNWQANTKDCDVVADELQGVAQDWHKQ